MIDLIVTQKEREQRGRVVQALVDHIRSGQTIKLPDFRPMDPLEEDPTFHGPFYGAVGDYAYQFEGEEDLLHLIVTRQDGEPLSVEQGRYVAAFLLPDVPPGLLWLRPGKRSQHFYLAHDELTR